MSRIIITGGSGFLGRHLCRALIAEGHQVFNIDLKMSTEVKTVIADVRNSDQMHQLIKDADAVFHLASLIEAGESVIDPQKYIDYNIDGTLNVLEAMRKNNIRTLLFSSSAAIYGDPAQTPIREDDRTIPVNPYGMTKLAMEGLLASYVKAFKFTGVALRYFNLYGPEEHHQPETHAVPRFIQQLLNDQPVSVYGDGLHVRDFIYISDVVTAHIAALSHALLNSQQYHYFNISTGTGETVGQVIKTLGELLGKIPEIAYQPERPGDPKILVANPEKAAEILNWRASVSLYDGLEKTVSYFVSKRNT